MPRKAKKYHFIYKTVNLLTGRYYIGMHSTDDLEDGYLGSGKRLRYSMRKYGKENHKREILEFVDTREELRAKEAEVVSLDEIAKDDCMNLVVGGDCGFMDTFSKEERQEISKLGYEAREKKKREDPEFYERWIAAISKGVQKAKKEGRLPSIQEHYDWSGRKHKKETVEKMRKAKIGHGKGAENSQHGTCWMTDGIANKKVASHEVEKLVKEGWSKGRIVNEEVRDKNRLPQEEIERRKALLKDIDLSKRGWVAKACIALNMKPGGVKRFVRTYIRK